jgi:PAS domain S-box-containing protein
MAHRLTYDQSFGGGVADNLHARLLDAVEQAVIATDLDGKVVYWNRFAEKLYGWTAAEVLGKSIQELTPSNTTLDEAREIMKDLTKGVTWRGNFRVQRKDGTTFIAHVVDSAVYDGDRQIGIVGVSNDVTEALEAADQREQLLESLEAEHQLVQQLSTPILRVGEQVLLLPLIGPIAHARADFISDRLLSSIRDERAQMVVLDVTSVGEMDRDVADWLVRTIQAARMLGSQVMLTGASPRLARTLVSIGTDLSDVMIFGDLQSGLEIALRASLHSLPIPE